MKSLLTGAAVGQFPAADGGWHRVPPWRPGLHAVIAFTGYAVFAVDEDVTDRQLRELGADGFGGAHHPSLVSALAGPDGWIDSLDVMLVARGTGASTSLVDRLDLADHPRACHAGDVRGAVRVLGYPTLADTTVGLIASGIAGLTELSFELDPRRRARGLGRQLVHDLLSMVDLDELVVACVAPGNAASLRAVLGAGFDPIGSVQLLRRADQHP